MKNFQAVFLAILVICAYGKVSFEDYRLVRLSLETTEQVKLLSEIETYHDVGFDCQELFSSAKAKTETNLFNE